MSRGNCELFVQGKASKHVSHCVRCYCKLYVSGLHRSRAPASTAQLRNRRCPPELSSVKPTTLLLNLMLPAGSCCAKAFSRRGRDTPRVSFTPPAALAACPHSLRSKLVRSLPLLLTNSTLRYTTQRIGTHDVGVLDRSGPACVDRRTACIHTHAH